MSLIFRKSWGAQIQPLLFPTGPENLIKHLDFFLIDIYLLWHHGAYFQMPVHWSTLDLKLSNKEDVFLFFFTYSWLVWVTVDHIQKFRDVLEIVDHFKPINFLLRKCWENINYFRRRWGKGRSFAGTIRIFASVAHWYHNQSIFGEILTCLKKRNIFLSQILTELERFENKENLWKFRIENP